MGQAWTIGAVRCDRVKGIGHRDDPRPQRNLCTLQPGWVASSIEPLVVMAHNRFEPGIPETGNHRGTLVGVAPHDGNLSVGEPARLPENFRWCVKLADIVNGSCRLDADRLLT